MAVTATNKVRVVESANSSTSQDTYEVLYKVHVDDKDTPLDDVLNSPTLPALGSEFDEIPYNFCTDKQAALVGSTRLVWHVTVTYTNKPLTIYSWGTKTRREVLTETSGFPDTFPITNSAGDPFSPALTKDIHMLTLKVEREEQSGTSIGQFDPGNVVDFVNTVNSDDISIDPLGAPYVISAYTGLMESITAVYNPGKDVWKVTYNITIRKPDPYWTINTPEYVAADKNAWVKRVLDAGLREIDPDSAQRRKIFDLTSRTATTKPLPLDGNGVALSGTSTPSDYKWLGFVQFDDQQWSSLAL
tara:strand:+ start:16122 stop:17027 length:906 start_codon:yes stop_codon:yes gene_type:complete